MTSRRAWPWLAVTALAWASVACGGDEPDDEAMSVVVPNSVVAQIVERTMCAEDVEVRVVADPYPTARSVGSDAVVTLEPPPSGIADGPVVVDAPTSARGIDLGGGADGRVWLDPIRTMELAESLAAALTTAGADAELLDRCLSRLRVELTAVDEQIIAAIEAVPEDERLLDVDVPGAVYVADRYALTIDDSEVATAAAEALTFDELDPDETYEQRLLMSVEAMAAVLAE